MYHHNIQDTNISSAVGIVASHRTPRHIVGDNRDDDEAIQYLVAAAGAGGAVRAAGARSAGAIILHFDGFLSLVTMRYVFVVWIYEAEVSRQKQLRDNSSHRRKVTLLYPRTPPRSKRCSRLNHKMGVMIHWLRYTCKTHHTPADLFEACCKIS